MKAEKISSTCLVRDGVAGACAETAAARPTATSAAYRAAQRRGLDESPHPDEIVRRLIQIRICAHDHHRRRRWQSGSVIELLAAEDSPRAWEDIPVVVLIGIVAGAAFLWIAIRSMFNRKDR